MLTKYWHGNSCHQHQSLIISKLYLKKKYYLWELSNNYRHAIAFFNYILFIFNDTAVYLNDSYAVGLAASAPCPAPSQLHQLCPPHHLHRRERCPIVTPIAVSHESYEGAEMRIVEAACAAAKQLELCSTSFPASALPTLPRAVFSQQGTRGHELYALCFWSRLRSHQLTQRQKRWQPVSIPGASLLHPVSVCQTKRWHEALADSAHQVSTYFFNLGRKQTSWPWFHSRETRRMLIIGHRRVTLLRLSSLHTSGQATSLPEGKGWAMLQTSSALRAGGLHHLHTKITHAGTGALLLNSSCPCNLGRCLKLKRLTQYLTAWHIQL